MHADPRAVPCEYSSSLGSLVDPGPCPIIKARHFSEWEWRPALFVKSDERVSLVNTSPSATPSKKDNTLLVSATRQPLIRAQSVGDTEFTPIALVNRNSTAEGIDELTANLSFEKVQVASASATGVNVLTVEGDYDSSVSSCSSGDSASERTVGDRVGQTKSLYYIPTSQGGPEYFVHRHTDAKKKLLIIMVGLPAQGKTFLAQKLCRLLGWNGCRSQVLNLQVAWREKLNRYIRRKLRREGNVETHTPPALATPTSAKNSGCLPPSLSTEGLAQSFDVAYTNASIALGVAVTPNAHHSHHHHHNYNGVGPSPHELFKAFLTDDNSQERKLYTAVLQDHFKAVQQFYSEGGQVTILNDDFPTKKLRQEAASLFAPLVDNVMYIEVQRNTEVNLDLLKVQGEYRNGMLKGEDILDDFQNRMQLMESVYQPLDPTDPSIAYVRLLDSSVLESHRLTGFLQSRIVSFLMNLTQVKISHPIYFCRHGQSEYNLDDRLGGDPNLTEKGRSDAEALYEFIVSLKEDLEDPSHRVQCTPRLLRNPFPYSQPTTMVMEYSNGTGTGEGANESTRTRELGTPLMSNCNSGWQMDSPKRTSAEDPNDRELLAFDGVATSGDLVKPMSFALPASSHETPVSLGAARANTTASASSTAPTSSPALSIANSHAHTDPSSLYAAQRRQLQSRDLEIWTSQLRRAIQTALPSEKRLGIKTLRLHSLNEIHAGVCEHMTYKEVKDHYPLIHRFRGEDKFAFRYPGGESYQDLVARLEQVIMELENANRVVVVVAHQAVLRGLLAYFGSTSAEECVNVEVPHRTVWRCTYDHKGISRMHSVRLGPKVDASSEGGAQT